MRRAEALGESFLVVTPVTHLAYTEARRADFSSKMLSQHIGTFLEAFWPYVNSVEVIRVRGTAKEFNDAKKFIPHAELYLFFLRNMRRGTDPIEPGHESIESQSFFVSPLAKFEEARRLLNRRQGLKIAPFRDHQILSRDTLVRCDTSKHRNDTLLMDIVVFTTSRKRGPRSTMELDR